MISAIEEHLDAANKDDAVQKRLTELRAQLRAKEDEVQGELVWNSPDAPYHAEQTCREAVEKGLLAPGTADFVDHQSKQLAGHPGWFLVTETVDAANAFNAKLRNKFVCKVSCSSPESCTTIDSPRQQ